MNETISINGSIGMSGDRQIFLGITTAKILHSFSFADVLNEETGNGYQRRFNPRHSLDFRRYIQTPKSTTIPLTLSILRKTDRMHVQGQHVPTQFCLHVSYSS